MKAENKLNELIGWAKNVGALPGEDVETLEKILEAVTVNRNRSGKRHKNARFAVDLFDGSNMRDWNLLPFGLQSLNDHFQSIVGHYTDRNTQKTSSAGDQLTYEVSFRDDLVGKLFVETMARALTTNYSAPADELQKWVGEVPRIVLASVNSLIDEMDKDAEAKGIATLTTELIGDMTEEEAKKGFSSLGDAIRADDPNLKIAGAHDEDLVDDSDVRCHRVEARRYPDPARPDDEDSGKDVILVTFFLKEDDVQKGAKVLIDDVWGPDPITIQAFVGAKPMFTGPTRHTLKKVEAIGTGIHWKGCRVERHDVMSVIISHGGDRNDDQVFYVTEMKEFDPA